MSVGKKDKSFGLVFLGLVLLLPFLWVLGGLIVNSILFDINCGDRIKRAADANTVEIAVTELEAVLAYAERTGRTQGYTSILWQQPSEDVGFWYNNLKTALDELKTVPSNINAGDRANVLKKLRETLMDHTQHGDKITIPDGLPRYPNNQLWFWGGLLTGILGVFGAGCIVLGFNPA